MPEPEPIPGRDPTDGLGATADHDFVRASVARFLVDIARLRALHLNAKQRKREFRKLERLWHPDKHEAEWKLEYTAIFQRLLDERSDFVEEKKDDEDSS